MSDKDATAGAKRHLRKSKYKVKFEKLLNEYKNIFIVGVDNVGSLQMQKVRIALRGKAEIIMGKNTLIRMIVREAATKEPKLEALLPLIRGNVGLVFTSAELPAVRTIMTEYKVPAGAKSGTMAPTDVFVPPGPTGLDPGQTGFFQALNIGTKIVKGAIEIINQVHLIKKGDKITSSAVSLLSKLDIKPFFYGMNVLTIYENGFVYPSSVLDITPKMIEAKFLSSVGKLQALSLAARWPSELTLPYYMANGFRKLLALSFATNYTFKEAEALKKAASEAPKEEKKAPLAKTPSDAGGSTKEKPAEKPKVEEKPAEEEDDGANLAGGLFD